MVRLGCNYPAQYQQIFDLELIKKNNQIKLLHKYQL